MEFLQPITASKWRGSLPVLAPPVSTGKLASWRLATGCNPTRSLHSDCPIIGRDHCFKKHSSGRLWESFSLGLGSWNWLPGQNQPTTRNLSKRCAILPASFVVAGAFTPPAVPRRLIFWGHYPKLVRSFSSKTKEVLTNTFVQNPDWKPEMLIWSNEDDYSKQTKKLMVAEKHWDVNKGKESTVLSGYSCSALEDILRKFGRKADWKANKIASDLDEVRTIMFMMTMTDYEFEKNTAFLLSDTFFSRERGLIDNSPFVAVLESKTKKTWADDPSLRAREWELVNKKMAGKIFAA